MRIWTIEVYTDMRKYKLYFPKLFVFDKYIFFKDFKLFNQILNKIILYFYTLYQVIND